MPELSHSSHSHQLEQSRWTTDNFHREIGESHLHREIVEINCRDLLTQGNMSDSHTSVQGMPGQTFSLVHANF